MITDVACLRYLECVHNSGAIYVYGADLEPLTQELLDKLKKMYGGAHYTNIDMKKHAGLLGADCSGLFTPISGVNVTASAYYEKYCKEKGDVSKMPKNRMTQLFRKENNKIVHTAMYDGNGKTYEMWDHCDVKTFNPSKWSYYGIPTWIEYTAAGNTSSSVFTGDFPAVPFVIKIKPNTLVNLYKDTNKTKVSKVLTSVNKYTIVEVKNGFGKFKSGAGWIDLMEDTYTIC